MIALVLAGLLMAGQAPPTLDDVDAALRSQPDSAELLKAKGSLLLRDRRRSAQARAPLERAVKLAPKDPEARYYLAQWACLHHEEALCLAEATASLRLAPGNADAALQLNTLIGIAAERLSRPAQAEKAFAAALEANRALGWKDPLAAFQYIDFLLKRGREEQAQPLVELLMKHAPTFGPAFLERAKHLARQEKFEEAIELAEYSLKLGAMDREKQRAAHLLLARTCFQMGRQEDAQRHQSWVEANP
jgi:tetratricopeptide (TPR) repeat protein